MERIDDVPFFSVLGLWNSLQEDMSLHMEHIQFLIQSFFALSHSCQMLSKAANINL
jgi:hypothetical protein